MPMKPVVRCGITDDQARAAAAEVTLQFAMFAAALMTRTCEVTPAKMAETEIVMNDFNSAMQRLLKAAELV